MVLIDRDDAIKAMGKAEWAKQRLMELPTIPDRMKLVQQAVNTIMSTSRSYSIRDRAFRNAARLVQNAIDGKTPDFEPIPEGDEMPPEWIPCSERLPENEDHDETFTVTIQCKHVDGWDDYVTGYADWTPHGWDIQSYYLGQIKVTAWMPLPEPYAERKTDDSD